jgi:hypothetical protein
MQDVNAPKFGWSIFGAWLYLILSLFSEVLMFPIGMIVRSLPLSDDGKLITFCMASVLVSPVLPLLSIREARNAIMAAKQARKAVLTFLAWTSLICSIVTFLVVVLNMLDYVHDEVRFSASSHTNS